MEKCIFLGKNVAPNLDIKIINFFMFLLLSEWSPKILTSIFGVVDRTPISSLAKVPELPRFNMVFFFA